MIILNKAEIWLSYPSLYIYVKKATLHGRMFKDFCHLVLFYFSKHSFAIRDFQLYQTPGGSSTCPVLYQFSSLLALSPRPALPHLSPIVSLFLSQTLKLRQHTKSPRKLSMVLFFMCLGVPGVSLACLNTTEESCPLCTPWDVYGQAPSDKWYIVRLSYDVLSTIRADMLFIALKWTGLSY
jgi:hypothetical protein